MRGRAWALHGSPRGVMMVKSGPLIRATIAPAGRPDCGVRWAKVGVSAAEAEAIATIKTVEANTFILEPLLSRGRVTIKNPPLTGLVREVGAAFHSIQLCHESLSQLRC